MMVVIAILGATNLYLIKKLCKKGNSCREVEEAQKLIKRNRKILIDQYLALGTLK